ncbi:hypothetical protein [Ornithinimicrobium sediminis]|uniref:hypothetical protein n=1 Tax=Ornithinimicrobium sediminis TaxID=2904603 RepID=UPI001E47BB23|nr:hypothetical protein [Ornithinimicrobium sediminis]MCE0488136.1 hypothetical protein [Ornithinimicrobium sediminis]
MQVAQVFTMMIESPLDVPEAPQAVFDSLAEWNDAHTRKRNVGLLRVEAGMGLSSLGEAHGRNIGGVKARMKRLGLHQE